MVFAQLPLTKTTRLRARGLIDTPPVLQIPTVPYGVGKSMESQNCYGRSQALGLSLGLSHQVEGEKAPAGASAGSVSSFEKGIVYTTALGGAASTETLSKGWAQMQC